MKAKINVVFILFFIMGFQLQYPVTMFPANPEAGIHQMVEAFPVSLNKPSGSNQIVGALNSDTGIHSASESLNNSETLGEYLILNRQKTEHEPTNISIESTPFLTSSGNRNVNQSHFNDLPDFNSERESLNRLKQRLNRNRIDSRKSVINSIKADLETIELERAQNKLGDSSANLQTRENILTTNNDWVKVNEQKLDKEAADKTNNNNVIKSTQSPSTQIVTDRSHFGYLKGGEVLNVKPHNDTADKINGIIWSPELVSKCPRGIETDSPKKWREMVRNYEIVKIETGCGSMQNRLITFNDSTKACVRYRLNADQMQGEIYSFYLGKLLKMNYTPPTTMHKVDDTEQWRMVRNGVLAAKWSDNKPVIVTKWLNSLEPVYMPETLRDIKRKLHQGNYGFDLMTDEEACDLVQWTDLIVFDYISANLDRVVNNMFNLKWNPNMLEKPIHNLEKTKSSGQYVFIDNESGLFHGYRLLDSYEPYHEQLLKSICVFKQSTIDVIEKLAASGNAGDALQNLYEKHEEFHGLLPRMGAKTKQVLQERIQTVFKHMELCKHASAKS